MSTAAEGQVTDTLVERFSLKALVESCLVLEEGAAAAKDIEMGMMMGAGILPGPFARADERGLDDVLEALERAESEWGENFTPPGVLRRLVAQGRLGKKTGQGFFPYLSPTKGSRARPSRWRPWRRGDHLAQPSSREPHLAGGGQGADRAVEGGRRQAPSRRVRLVEHLHLLRGADIKEFTKMSPDKEGAELLETRARFMRAMEESSTVTVAR